MLLRPVELTDAQPMFAILADAEVNQYFGTVPMEDVKEAEARCAKLADGLANREQFRLALVLKESGAFVGTAGFWRWVLPHYRAEIGYEIDKACWGKGLMVEALRPILAHGFAHGIHAVEANTHPDNHASRRVLEKLGFQQEGYQREWYFEFGEFTDNVLFGLREAEFLR